MRAVDKDEFAAIQKQKLRTIGNLREFAKYVAIVVILLTATAILFNLKSEVFWTIFFWYGSACIGSLLICAAVYLLADIAAELILSRKG